MNECVKCGNKIKDEYFNAVSGKMCKKCLKEMCVYYALRSLNLINSEGGNLHEAHRRNESLHKC